MVQDIGPASRAGQKVLQIKFEFLLSRKQEQDHVHYKRGTALDSDNIFSLLKG